MSGRVTECDFTMQRYAMRSLDNLLIMDSCSSCGRDLASAWKFCIYCGRPLHSDTPTPSVASAAAIRAEIVEAPSRKYDGPFWVGISMAALGLVLIIYWAVQVYGSYV